MKPIFNEDFFFDMVAVLAQLDEFALGLGIEHLQFDQEKIASIIKGMKHDFPYSEGVDAASIFKKVANFMVYFCSEQPIYTSMPDGLGDLSKRKINPVFAVDIGFNALKGAVIHKKCGDCTIERIRISRHAYLDLLDLLGAGTTPSAHMHWVSLYLEQLVYKSNDRVEYDDCAYQ